MKSPSLFFSVIFMFFSFGAVSQVKPILYGGVDYIRDTGFEGNAYGNINFGAQVLKWKFIAPEIGFEHYFGSPRTREELNPLDANARATSKLETRFTTTNLSVAPKLIFGNDEAALVIVPQYNWGRIKSRGRLLDDTGRQYVLVDEQQFSEPISFWSFAAGVEGQFFESEVLHFSLLLKYNLIDSKSSLENIDFENSPLQSNGGSIQGLGLAFRVYFDVLELLNK